MDIIDLLDKLAEKFSEFKEDAYWREQWAIAIQDDNERLRANAGN